MKLSLLQYDVKSYNYKTRLINNTCNTTISMQKIIGVLYLSAKKYT